MLYVSTTAGNHQFSISDDTDKKGKTLALVYNHDDSSRGLAERFAIGPEAVEFLRDLVNEPWRLESEDEREKAMFEAREFVERIDNASRA